LKNREPLYQALANKLEERIQSGFWSVGSLLPSEASLCKSYKASRHTLRHALQVLEVAGLILRRQGAQAQVISRHKPRKFSQNFNSPADILRYPRDTYRTNLIEEYVELNDSISKLVGAPAGSSWYHIGGIRKQEGSEQIIAWTDIYILPQFAQLSGEPDHSKLMVFEQIEKKFGTKIDRAEVDVYASKAIPIIAKHIKIKPGDPCLVIIRRYYDSRDQLFEITVTYHPEDRYTYSMEFKGASNY
jgi:DNA-binding GntR family transcriptional regulator